MEVGRAVTPSLFGAIRVRFTGKGVTVGMPSGEGKGIGLFVSLCYHFVRGDNYEG